jgi:hypothetical protein
MSDATARALDEGLATEFDAPAGIPDLLTRRNVLTGGALVATMFGGITAGQAAGGGDPLLRLVHRLTMGITEYEVQLANTLGFQGYLDYHLDYQAIDDSVVDSQVAFLYPTLTMNPTQLFQQPGGVPQNQLIESTIYRSVLSKKQFFQRMVEFWTDHFNSDINKIGVLKTVDDLEVIRAHALGRFPDMLSASAHSPCMLIYLDNNTSVAGNPNENYGRELLELHSLGVLGGYTQTDVTEVSRCLTGWTYNSQAGTNFGRFFFNPARHDNGPKVVLGNNIPANGGQQDGETVLTILSNHSSTAQYVAMKLTKFLLEYDPPQKLIDSVASTYTSTGGDIKAMIRVILTEDNLTNAPLKLKRPYALMTSMLRSVNANITNASSIRFVILNGMGMIPFYWSPPDGYPDTLDFWGKMVLPRWNSGFSLMANQVGGVSINLTALLNGANTAATIAARINSLLFAGQMPTNELTALENYLLPNPPTTARIQDAFGLAMAAPSFQWY